jgi:hypothetical protein
MMPSIPPTILENKKLQPLVAAIASKGTGEFFRKLDHVEKTATVKDFPGYGQGRVIHLTLKKAASHSTITMQYFGDDGAAQPSAVSNDWAAGGKSDDEILVSPEEFYLLIDEIVEVMNTGTKQ